MKPKPIVRYIFSCFALATYFALSFVWLTKLSVLSVTGHSCNFGFGLIYITQFKTAQANFFICFFDGISDEFAQALVHFFIEMKSSQNTFTDADGDTKMNLLYIPPKQTKKIRSGRRLYLKI